MRWLKALDDWWFGSRSPAAICLVRILLGALTFVSLALTLTVFSDFYTPDGYAPNRMIESYLRYSSDIVWIGTPMEFRLPFEVPRLTLLGGEPAAVWTLTVYLATMAAAVLFTIGKWTRAAGFALAIGLMSIHTRNPLIIHSGDTLLRLCIFYLAFSPCGRMYSLDARRRASGNPASEVAGAEGLVRVTSQRLIQYQVAMVYLFTAWWKFFGTFWMDGTATWYPAQMHEFHRFPLPAFLERQPFVMIETYGTLAVEIALGTLVFWKPARKWVLILGLLMHAYIEYHFNIPMFAFIICSTYIVFYEGEEVEAWVVRMRERWIARRSRTPIAEQAS